jgi:hypothetical protein
LYEEDVFHQNLLVEREQQYFINATVTETKQQSSQWKSLNSPRPKKSRQVKSKVKSMLIIFFAIKGIVHKELVLAGKTVNSAYFCDVSRRLRENVRKTSPRTVATIEQTVASRQHTVSHFHFTKEFLTKNNKTVVSLSPYSPDLAPCDFLCFPH